MSRTWFHTERDAENGLEVCFEYEVHDGAAMVVEAWYEPSGDEAVMSDARRDEIEAKITVIHN
jgi:hypothetical protein